MNFNKLYLFIAKCFLHSFLSKCFTKLFELTFVSVSISYTARKSILSQLFRQSAGYFVRLLGELDFSSVVVKRLYVLLLCESAF